ncbi:DUF1269 domain-containing protein [Catenulispora pinisilvae]|uniref:DUF1269 domain-containing protein n=1 Tax=Catenulispora pinisilvae TaxID=2705253 RepID=UPI0018921B1D|nr:DUF1269 domain-containing protein [Catenulispora pinisilvae]
MATLTVWKFDAPDGAEKVLAELEELQKQELIRVLDGAVVSWPAEAKRPRTSQLADLTGRGALGGAFWGFLFGLLFFVPLLGMAVGAAAGALGGSMANVGIDKDFIEQVKAKVTPGTSALFVLSADEVEDRVLPTLERAGAELIKTNLSAEQEAQLREAFAEDMEQAGAAGGPASGAAAGNAAPAATPAPTSAPKPGPPPAPKPGPSAPPKPGPPPGARAAGAAAARDGIADSAPTPKNS